MNFKFGVSLPVQQKLKVHGKTIKILNLASFRLKTKMLEPRQEKDMCLTSQIGAFPTVLSNQSDLTEVYPDSWASFKQDKSKHIEQLFMPHE